MVLRNISVKSRLLSIVGENANINPAIAVSFQDKSSNIDQIDQLNEPFQPSISSE